LRTVTMITKARMRIVARKVVRARNEMGLLVRENGFLIF
jgi:hypothetical protein